MQGHPPPDLQTGTIEALAEALDATPQQTEAIRAAANENKRRNAAIFLKPPLDGAPSPAHYIVDQLARGIDTDSEIGRGLIANYLENCRWPEGGSHLDALGRSNRASLDVVSDALTTEQAQRLREIAPDGLGNFHTGVDALGEAMRSTMVASNFTTWEALNDAANFPEAVAARLLDEFTVLKEQLSAVLQATPAEGGEAPLDYQARLIAAGDPNAGAALDTYLESCTDPAFNMKYRAVMERAQHERLLRILQDMEGQARGQFQRLWRQSVMGLRLPGDRFDALLAQKIQALKSHRFIDHNQGMSPVSWTEFCRGLLLTSAQEASARAIIGTLQKEQDVDAALSAEARARAEIEALLAPAQRGRWSAFTRRSLFTIQIGS